MPSLCPVRIRKYILLDAQKALFSNVTIDFDLKPREYNVIISGLQNRTLYAILSVYMKLCETFITMKPYLIHSYFHKSLSTHFTPT